jgi:hypothetical protein
MRLVPPTAVAFVRRHFAAEAAVWALYLVAINVSTALIIGDFVVPGPTSDTLLTAGLIVTLGCVMAWFIRRDRRLNRRKPLDNLRFRGRLLDGNAFGIVILAATVLFLAVTYDRWWLAFGDGLVIAAALVWLVTAWRRMSPDSAR